MTIRTYVCVSAAGWRAILRYYAAAYCRGINAPADEMEAIADDVARRTWRETSVEAAIDILCRELDGAAARHGWGLR